MPETTNNVRLQNLRDFTVQIRHAETDAIVGTGIAVSMAGQIVTCAHVVEAAGVEPRISDEAEVGIYFPQARGGEEKKRRATIEKVFADYDDDVVLLQLTGGPSPLAPGQIAILGTAEDSHGNAFRSYGYYSMGTYPASWADGMILGSVEPPADKSLQVDPVQLRSQQIAEGMSGSGVLDVERNLLVGIISETYYPRSDDPKHRDTAWSVNGRVLGFTPLNLPLHDQPLPLQAAKQPKTEESLKQQVQQVARETVSQRVEKDKYTWHAAPSVLDEFTGREAFLKQINEDWNDPKKHVTGLIGFGGEGKSSLARKWIDNLLKDSEQIQPDGLFWWGFYENRSVDEFFEAALNYMSGGRIDPKAIPSASMRAQVIASMLGSGSYLFVLDGLEVMQHQDGDQYGLIQSNDLRDFLSFFAAPDHESFCLVTSRAPLLDLMDYTTYTHRDVTRLLLEDGIALLRRLGVNGDDKELGKIISDWDGHALTVNLLGSYLVEHFEGDIAHLDDIPLPTEGESRYERVHRVLRRYDKHLSDSERDFLKLFAAFRTPVHEDAFEKVFEPLLKVPDSQITNIVDRLVTYRLLRHDPASKTYTAHPLIRNHYLALLAKGKGQEKEAHEQIKDYYLSIAGDMPSYPSLDNLRPLIEVVHHACQAGAYDEAFDIFLKNIQRGPSQNVLDYQLGAYETELLLMLEFLDETQQPKTNRSDYNRFILNEIGFCLMTLGRLREAIPFYERQNEIALEMEDWRNLSITYQNLAELQASLGALEESAAARQALDLARRAENKHDEATSQSWLGTATHLLGKTTEASSAFLESERLRLEAQPNVRYLYSFSGIRHADHLHRIGNIDYARRVTEANLEICKRNRIVQQISQCHRVLGDSDADVGDHTSARENYDAALKIAHGISFRPALIEALLARGRWAAKGAKTSEFFKKSEVWIAQAFSNLNEALGYAVEGEYRIYEADIRVTLAWAHLANDEKQKAKAEAERALSMSVEMGYLWGQVDAKEVLERT